MGAFDTRTVLLAAGITVLSALPARAQLVAYGVAGPAGFTGFFGSSSNAIHAAGGGEVLFRRMVGVGGEFGVFGNSGSALLVGSANGVLHLAPGSSKYSPFITGGYTHMGSGEGDLDAWNVGLGMDVWAKEHVGFRVEFRDHVRPDDRGTVQYWTFRLGVAFR